MSDDARWLRIKELFRQSQMQAEQQRDAWLVGQCGEDGGLLREVRALLAAQEGSHDILDHGAAGALRQMGSAEPASDLVGQRIGAYRLLRLIGEGGMGSVYLAEREDGDFRQRAALKLIRADYLNDEARARFLRERRILAQLTHPHIAQLHDGGMASDGTPYFTLEYVEGEPITSYCDARKLTICDRLRLVLQVCAAVAYAHRNLIVHRDLKPSNIFVTADGEVKLLDFGIAKLLDPEAAEGKTATQARMMTPEYAAPEQVLGEAITTATDVYAIGVVLYELLSGRLPYARADAGAISWPKAVIEEAPEPVYRALSRTTTRGATPTGDAAAAARGLALPALRRALQGDLDRILQRALAKTAEARYATVGALAADLSAYLEGRAISGGTRTYRMRKFVSRYWLPIAAAAAILTILIASGAAIVWEARQTEHEARATLAVKDFLYGLFSAVDPHLARGREVSAHELLDRGAQNIERNKALDADQRAEIESTLGRIYFQLGLFDQANKLQQSAIAALTARPVQALLLVRTEAQRADTLTDLGDLKIAQTLADEARHRIDALPSASVADRAEVATAQARVALQERDFPKTKRYADEAIALARKIAGSDSHALFQALQVSGAASWGLTRTDQAEASWREAVAVALRNAVPDDLDVARARGNVAMALQVESHFAEARQLEAQALATEETMLGRDHPITLETQRDLALANYHLGYYAQARTMLERVLAAQRKKLGDGHPAIAGTEINLGILLVDSGDADAAERVLTKSVAIFEKKYGRAYQGARIALGDLAAAHIAQGKLDQAQAELMDELERERKAGTPEMGDFIDHERLGDIKRRRGDTKTAIELQRAALAAAHKDHGESSRFTATAHLYLARSLRDSGDAAGAVSEYRAALSAFAGYLPNGEHPLAATASYELAPLLLQHDATRMQGITLLAKAAAMREKFLGADDPETKQAREALRKAQSPDTP
ncbi:MAG: serine/threonine-protein kinase [Rudaea sp.]